jgi:alcohol dehydrogenase
LDADAYERSGAAATVEPFLASRRAHRFTGFEPNPKIEDVERGVAAFRRARPDVVLAIGGGTALDLAKVIGTCGADAVDVRACVIGAAAPARDGPPLVAVPTTAGTGSEATHFAVVYVEGSKYSFAHAFLRPDVIVLDPQLTYSLPSRLSAVTGLDALCQGIESLWAIGSTETSRDHAYRAVELALAHLPDVVREHPSPVARHAMLEAAYHSGCAIDIGKTTAAHAVSYTLSSRYGVPHGAAVALTLGAFIVFNAQVDEASCTDPRGVGHVRDAIRRVVETLGASSAEDARARIEAFVAALGCPTRLGEVGVDEAGLARLVADVNLERLGNNPRRLGARQLDEVLRSVL